MRPFVSHRPDPPDPIFQAGSSLGRQPLALPDRLTRWIDGSLRRRLGIFEFAPSPDCLLRLSLHPADGALRLADGTVIAPGDPVGELHLWNERIAPLVARRTNFAAATAIRRGLQLSLRRLAAAIESDPRLANVQAFCATTALVTSGRGWKMMRFAEAFGFEPSADPGARRLRRILHDHLEDILLWMLRATFNPGGARSRGLHRQRHRLWISRHALIRRYGAYPAAAEPGG